MDSRFRLEIFEEGIISESKKYQINKWPFGESQHKLGKKSYIQLSNIIPFDSKVKRVPIYRYLHKSNGDHFYTTNSNPKGKWKHQGIEFYAFPSSE